jgi:hypothetical protein
LYWPGDSVFFTRVLEIHENTSFRSAVEGGTIPLSTAGEGLWPKKT